MSSVPVRIEPDGGTVWVEEGATVLEAARAAGVVIPAPCGGRGICGACGVRVLEGVLGDPDDEEIAGLRRAPAGVRLACRARVVGPVTIRPMTSHPRVDTQEVSASAGPLVAGVDLGTTSVAAAVVDVGSGRELARASVANAQQSWGADVLSRVSAAMSGAGEELRVAAERSVAEALEYACDAAGVEPAAIERVVIAGNSAMAGLLAGAEMSGLAAHPFSAPFGGGEYTPVFELAKVVPAAVIRVAPPLGAFVGGDAVAAVLGCGLLGRPRPALLVDVGTNAEIVLATADGVFAASAAAGPAFEGVGVTCGGPAAPGAVTRVEIAGGGVSVAVMGDEEPGWFSGSGLVSALAEMKRAGILGGDGAFRDGTEFEARMSLDEGGVRRFDFGEAGAPACLELSQLDIRALQLAKAAVRAGIEAVLRAARTSSAQLASVQIAGAFGSALAARDLVELGILPADVAHGIESAGNAALAGAARMAIEGDATGRDVAELESARVLDLAADAGFNARLMAALRLEEFRVD